MQKDSTKKVVKVLGGKVKTARKDRPQLWQGPESDGPEGGITNSLLQKYLCCKERFRLMTIEGLMPKRGFAAPIEFGNMWHVCEEYWGSAKPNYWQTALADYCKALCRRYPLDQADILHWQQMCGHLFPVANRYWESHPDQQARVQLLPEQKFCVPYGLPSGRTVYLRGKWDSVDIIKRGKDCSVYLQENKTKAQIDRNKITNQLRYDCQTMLYLVALEEVVGGEWALHEGKSETHDRIQEAIDKIVSVEGTISLTLSGVRYNVVRRSAHKTPESMLKKVSEDIASKRGGEWFDRWNVLVTPNDVDIFRTQTLDPLLEDLCQDFAWWEFCKRETISPYSVEDRHKQFGDEHLPHHYRRPYDGRNAIDEGRMTAYDDLLTTGSTLGLQNADTLFPELQE